MINFELIGCILLFVFSAILIHRSSFNAGYAKGLFEGSKTVNDISVVFKSILDTTLTASNKSAEALNSAWLAASKAKENMIAFLQDVNIKLQNDLAEIDDAVVGELAEDTLDEEEELVPVMASATMGDFIPRLDSDRTRSVAMELYNQLITANEALELSKAVIPSTIFKALKDSLRIPGTSDVDIKSNN